MSTSFLLKLLIGAAATSTLLAAGHVLAADAPAKKKQVAAKAPAPLPDLTEEQIAAAERVLTGVEECEFNQKVEINPAEKAGYFKVAFKGKTYVVAPEVTTTGAVRLEDKKAGIVWLQIANKSMLMNSKVGRRLVDECIHPTQRS
jgi:hypothetical protein